jgi:lysophospholipase L1-like esterase
VLGAACGDDGGAPQPDAAAADGGRLDSGREDRGAAADAARLEAGRPDAGGQDAFAGKPSVWIVGDSLAVGAGPPAQAQMTKYAVTVRAKVGATIDNRYPEVVNAVAAKADAIVIQAGINDVGSGTANVAALTNDVGRTLDATKGTRCVYWVTAQTKYTKGYLALNKSAPTLNQVIRGEVAKRSWAAVVEFQPYIDQHPELNAPDGLHLTAAGYQKLAGFYHDALKGCFGF